MSFYIALEGIDGAGKTSCQAELARWLREQGQEVVCVREPGDTPVGRSIRSLLLEGEPLAPWSEAAMFTADRAQLAEEVVRPALERGAWVISDRSVYSSLAYQGGGRRLGMAEVRSLNQAALGGTWPDLVVLLEVGVEEGLARQLRSDRIGSETSVFMTAVVEAYRQLAQTDVNRFIKVDASRTLPEVTEEVVRQAEKRVSLQQPLWKPASA